MLAETFLHILRENKNDARTYLLSLSNSDLKEVAEVLEERKLDENRNKQCLIIYRIEVGSGKML